MQQHIDPRAGVTSPFVVIDDSLSANNTNTTTAPSCTAVGGITSSSSTTNPTSPCCTATNSPSSIGAPSPHTRSYDTLCCLPHSSAAATTAASSNGKGAAVNSNANTQHFVVSRNGSLLSPSAAGDEDMAHATVPCACLCTLPTAHINKKVEAMDGEEEMKQRSSASSPSPQFPHTLSYRGAEACGPYRAPLWYGASTACYMPKADGFDARRGNGASSVVPTGVYKRFARTKGQFAMARPFEHYPMPLSKAAISSSSSSDVSKDEAKERERCWSQMPSCYNGNALSSSVPYACKKCEE